MSDYIHKSHNVTVLMCHYDCPSKWSKGYYVNMVSKHGNEDVVSKYVQQQGAGEYSRLHKEEECWFQF